jgi:hypothetical protein
MKWTKGRQNSGYETLTLIKKGFKCFRLSGFDLHLIRYNDGDYIPPHVDTVDENNHYRLNLVLKKPKSGGEFYCEKQFKLGRLHIFRPDKYIHSVTKCIGTRYVFSFGVCLKQKPITGLREC